MVVVILLFTIPKRRPGRHGVYVYDPYFNWLELSSRSQWELVFFISGGMALAEASQVSTNSEDVEQTKPGRYVGSGVRGGIHPSRQMRAGRVGERLCILSPDPQLINITFLRGYPYEYFSVRASE